MDVAVNYLAVVAAAVVAMIVGSLWYSSLLFGKQWMALTGRDPESMKGMPPPMKEIFAELLASLLTAFTVAVLIAWIGAHTLAGGLVLGFWLWLGFYVPALLAPVLWERRPLNLFFLNASMRFVSILLISAIVVLWQ